MIRLSDVGPVPNFAAMHRMQLILAINQHLKGLARRTRAQAGGIADYFLFYIRQMIRYRERWMPLVTDVALGKEIRLNTPPRQCDIDSDG